MKGFRLFGDYALEFLVVSLIMAVSALSVILFIPALVGVTGYFQTGIDCRRFKDIFVTIGKNIKIIIFYTLFQLVILVFPILNIYFFNTHPQNVNYFVLAVSCIALFIGIIYLVTAPTVIVKMNVTLRQLFYNGIMLVFGGALTSLLGVLCVAGVVALIIFYPFGALATLYLVPLAVTKLMSRNFIKLKAKALKISVFELNRRESEDDYLDENGEVVREEGFSFKEGEITENENENI